jgi:hypothetical protein
MPLAAAMQPQDYRRVAAASASLPMVCPFAIGKAFGLGAATRFDRHSSVGHSIGLSARRPISDEKRRPDSYNV